MVATVLSLVIGTAMVPVANAADRSDVITDAWISRTQTADKPLYQNETINFGFTWDASTASPPVNVGDTITITLPDWAQIPTAKTTMRDANDVPVAECVQTPWKQDTPATVVCTFTDYVTKEETKLNLHGEYKAQVNIRTVGELTPTEFTFGTVVVPLSDIADQSVIDAGSGVRPPTTYNPTKLNEQNRKTGYFNGVASYTMGEAVITWELWVNGTGQDIVITDPMALPQQPAKYVAAAPNFENSVRVRVRDRVAEGDTGGNWETAPNGTATFLPTDEYDATWEETATANNLTITIPNSSPDKVYRIQVYTGMPADALVNGAQVANTATMDGYEVKYTTIATNMINAWATGSPDKGDLYIYKSVSSADGTVIPELATQSYQIKATWKENEETKTETFTVPVLDPNDANADAVAGKLRQLPAGTEILLEELPLDDGATYSWTDLIIKEGKYGTTEGGAVKTNENGTATVTIMAGQRVQVNFNNVYQAKTARVSVGDYVWLDSDKDGIQDDDEKGIQGVTLTLTGPDGQPVTDVNGNAVAPVVTDAEGKYSFTDLPVLKDGESYTVTVSNVPAGYQPTKAQATDSTTANDSSTGSASSTGLTKDGEEDKTLDFGFVQPSVAVGNYVWFDTNADGNQDEDEAGIDGVELRIVRTDGEAVQNLDGTTRTDLTTVTTTKDGKAGYYIFENLPVLPDGVKYVVEVIAPRGMVPTVANAHTSTSASDSSTGQETAVQLISDGETDMTLDFGFVPGTVSVGDYVWFDSNSDGIQGDDEEGINGVTLTISRSDNGKVLNADGTERTELTTTTADKDGKAGYYAFTNLPILPAGVTYVVTVTTPDGYVATSATAGDDTAVDSNTGSATAVELTQAGQNDPTLDFGFVRTLGAISLTKKVEGISGFLFGRSTDFPVTVTWTEDGAVKTEEVTVRHGQTVQLPNIPAGTEVTIKETMPNNNLISEWRTPSYQVNVDGAVENADGSVTFTIPANTNPAEPVQAITVTITNVANPPLWWLLIPLIPIIANNIPPVVPGSSDPGQPTPVSGETTVPGQPTPAAGESTTPGTPSGNGNGGTNPNGGTTAGESNGATKGVAKGATTTASAEPAKATGLKGLANTGASVWAINGLALLLILIGAFVAYRSRHANQ